MLNKVRQDAQRWASRFLFTIGELVRLKPAHRYDMLTGNRTYALSPLVFFGATSAFAFAVFNLLERFVPIRLEFAPSDLRSLFDASILGVELRYVFVELVNALILSLICCATLAITGYVRRPRVFISAFLYGYGLVIPILLLFRLLATSFFVATYDTETQALGGFFPSELGKVRELVFPEYWLPNVYPIFNALVFSFVNTSNYDEYIWAFRVIDFSTLVAVLILRPGIIRGIVAVVVCSLFSYHVDLLATRYSGKNHGLIYGSARMLPSLVPYQHFVIETGYYDKVPLKAGNLILVDFLRCKVARHSWNHGMADGSAYDSGNNIHFDPTLTYCSEARPQVLDYLVPQYEITRVIGLPGQRVKVASMGAIFVDEKQIAMQKTREQINIPRQIPDVTEDERRTLNFDDLLTLAQQRPKLTITFSGYRSTYAYGFDVDRFDPAQPTYIWECSTKSNSEMRAVDKSPRCSDDTLFDITVPKGSILAMFDNAARPRFVLLDASDVIGRPFTKFEKRW